MKHSFIFCIVLCFVVLRKGLIIDFRCFSVRRMPRQTDLFDSVPIVFLFNLMSSYKCFLFCVFISRVFISLCLFPGCLFPGLPLYYWFVLLSTPDPPRHRL